MNKATTHILDATRQAIYDAAGDAQARQHGNYDASTSARLSGFIEVAAAAQQELAQAVRGANSMGMSWQDIGALFGTSKQAAQQRFGS